MTGVVSARRSGWSRSLNRAALEGFGAEIDRLKHCASMRRPSSSGRPCPVRAASRSVRSAGWGARRWSRPARLPAEAGAAGHDLVDEADAFGFAGVDHAPGDDQFDRAAVPEDAGKPLRATVGQPDVPASAGDAERGVLVGDRHVGPACPLQAAGVGDAVDGRDGGLVDVGPSRRAEHAVGRAGDRRRSSPPNAALRSPPAQNACHPRR